MSWRDYNYERGRQIIIHDPRLQAPRYPGLSGPENPNAPQALRPLAVPPACWRTITVDPGKETVATIFSKVASACDAAKLPAGSQFDALHIMAHGLEGYIELGKDTLRRETLQVTVKIANRFRYVVFHSCLVGKMDYQVAVGAPSTAFGGSQFARKVAQHTKAKVILARQLQYFGTKLLVIPAAFVSTPLAALGPDVRVLDFGDWEGPVDLYEEHVPVRTFNKNAGDPFNLQKLIFGTISG